jgi:3-dehydroquinate synthase
MVMAADLSARLGHIPSSDVTRIQELVTTLGLPNCAPKLGNQRFFELMQIDKKSEGGEIRYITLEKIGRAKIEMADHAIVSQTLSAYQAS